jgi:putative tricarboxylic transport membrane protein
METIFTGFGVLFSNPILFLLMFFGVFMGIIFGAIPGLTTTLCVLLFIPFTFSMTAPMGLALLVSIYVGGVSGGLITAILTNIPGTSSALITCWDGYPMAKNGKPAEALAIGVFCSFFGGTVSAIMLFGIAPQLAKVTLFFGSWEYFTVCLMGLVMVTSSVGDDMVKGLLGACIGLVLGAVGIDVMTGVPRMTFGFWQLQGGITMTALMMGMYAFREILTQAGKITKIKIKSNFKRTSFFPPFKEMEGCRKVLVLGSLLGTWIGILPGIGQLPATILAYNQARNMSKHPERFGHGSAEGICASEVTNNAVNGGALIPLITLGLPGDGITAAIIGGFMIHGIQPGPLLFTRNVDLVGTIMVVYFLANFVMYFMELGLMKAFVQIVNVSKAFLFPTIIVCCLVGLYTLGNNVFDLGVMLVFAIVGLVLSQLKIDLAGLILGFVLGPVVEQHLRRALIASRGDVFDIFKHPLAVVFLFVSIICLFWPFINKAFKREKSGV